MTNLSFDLTGRGVVVTGATRGVGGAIGEQFHDAGATVYLIGSDAEEVRAAEEATGAVGVVVDVSDTAGRA